MSTPCIWPGCWTEAQRAAFALTIDGDGDPSVPDQRLICGCDEAPSNEMETENG